MADKSECLECSKPQTKQGERNIDENYNAKVQRVQMQRLQQFGLAVWLPHMNWNKFVTSDCSNKTTAPLGYQVTQMSTKQQQNLEEEEEKEEKNFGKTNGGDDM